MHRVNIKKNADYRGTQRLNHSLNCTKLKEQVVKTEAIRF